MNCVRRNASFLADEGYHDHRPVRLGAGYRLVSRGLSAMGAGARGAGQYHLPAQAAPLTHALGSPQGGHHG